MPIQLLWKGNHADMDPETNPKNKRDPGQDVEVGGRKGGGEQTSLDILDDKNSIFARSLSLSCSLPLFGFFPPVAGHGDTDEFSFRG